MASAFGLRMALRTPYPMKTIIRFLRALVAPALCILTASSVWAQTGAEDFEDGAFTPFWVEVSTGNISEIITPTGFSARGGTKVHHIKWFQANYDGTRATKSVEGTSSNITHITSDGWYGFSFYLPESFPATGKEMELAQIHGWHPSLPATNSMIGVNIKPDGKLYLTGGYGVGDGGKIDTAAGVLSHGLAKGAWHDVVIYCKLSRINTGILRAWIDGAPESAPTVDITGINLGNGAWTSDELMTTGAYVKWGPYCWDTGHYTVGESRELFYDEITFQVGNPAGAFDLVKPNGYGTGYAVPVAGATVMAETFDAMTTGSQPTGMTVVNGTGNTLSVREIPSATDKCMQFYDPNATTHGEATKTFTPQTGRFMASWSFRQNGAADGHTMSLLSGGLLAIEIYTSGGNLVYRDGAGVERVLQAIPPIAFPLTWYDVDVDINPVTFKADVYVGGVRKLTGATFRNAATSIDRIRFGTSDASSTYHLYVNDITITQPPVTMNEVFDPFGANANPRYWTIAAATNTSILVSLTPTATDKSVKFTDTNAAGKAEASRAFIAQTEAFTAGWSFMQSATADGHRMALNHGYNQTAVELVTSAGKLMYKNAAGTNIVVQTITANTWYNVQVVVRPATAQADVYVNNVLKLSNQSLRTSLTRVDRIVFGTSDALAAGDLFIDNVTVNATPVPAPAPLAVGIPRLPIVLKLDDLSTGGGNVPNGWRRVTDFAAARQLKLAIGLIAKSLEIGTPSYISYIQGQKNTGRVEIWFHGYDHVGQEFNGTTYADQKNRFVTSQALAQTKLGFKFEAFGAPENASDATTAQVMSEDPDMAVWLYGNPATPAGKRVLERVSAVNIESPTFVPNPEKFISGYLANYVGRQYFVIQGHPGNWTDARWAEFVRLIDWLQANNFPIMTSAELDASLP